ncbi:AAA family ATPase [Prevotella melaninogenica]|uniref:AAA family ATPase n=1 Tax=Prevotella melaninogenica TaxID=28132 RepID=UPI001BA91AAB|nr:AAA family ATPase [Prevotella melaninogenica]QUB66738.1 AAA family ATPase [Prevotella melaninogenica]
MKSIEIKNFKAFNKNSILLGDVQGSGHKNILCYGENGSGKTSIYEAIKFFFFKEKIIGEKIPSSKVGPDREAEIRQLEINYRNKSVQEEIFIEIDGKSSRNFNYDEQEVYMVSGKDLLISNDIDIFNILEKCYLSSVTVTSEEKDVYSEVIVEEVNRVLSTYFYTNIKIRLSQDNGNKIVVIDSIRGLESEKLLHNYFNESIIHIIKLIIILSYVLLHQDSEKSSLLVFDDIVTSMDNSYRSFLYRYIQDEFKSFQLVILTHSTSFFNLCEHWISEKNENDNWVIQGLYENGGNHKIYTKGILTTENIKEKINKDEVDIKTLGNETRQLFEMLIQQFCMLTMIGAKEETDKLIAEISNQEENKSFLITEQKVETSVDLLNKVRSYLKNCPEEKKITKITEAIESFDKGKFNILTSWLNEMKMYQKSTLHQASHGHTGLPDISSKELKASLQVLSKLESTIKKMKIGRIQS